MARINYLNNKDLLLEITKSKNTYSEFLSSEYEFYDAVICNIDEVNEDFIREVKEKKATLQFNNEKQRLKELGLKKELKDLVRQDPSTIPTESLVFRYMTHDHIPENLERVKKKKTVADYKEKVNFPPFKHLILENEEFKEVGRSHWVGGFHNGHFSIDHGRMTDKLAHMIKLLVEKYAQKGNWRGYCVDEDTEALTKRGWLGINQITEEDTILSYDENKLKWSSIESIFRDDYSGNMFHMTSKGFDSLVTPGHKFVTDRGLVKAEYLKQKDRLILMSGDLEDGSGIYSDSLVELIGWVVTEGNYYKDSDRNYTRVTIYQNEGEYSDRIEKIILDLGSTYGKTNKDGKNSFSIPKELSETIVSIAPNKLISIDFLLSLTQSQRELLINTMIDADGWRNGELMRFSQKRIDQTDLFVTLCSLSGYRTSTKYDVVINSFGSETTINITTVLSHKHDHAMIENVDFHGGKGDGRRKELNTPTVPYTGKVWCPKTEYGCFVARRKGKVHITGNTYNDEMQARAMLQLCTVGLQFNESKSDNPFAYYTCIATNAFTGVLNAEKRSQEIRDDILIMSGVMPSMTRQVENEMEQKQKDFNDEHGIVPSEVVVKRKYGRPKKGEA